MHGVSGDIEQNHVSSWIEECRTNVYAHQRVRKRLDKLVQAHYNAAEVLFA
jgi:hypothetical protein